MLFALCYFFLWLPIHLFYPVKVIGKKNLPKKQGYVLTCNHYSNLDPILLDIYLKKKIRFLAKQELFKNKFFGYILKRLGAFPVNRAKPEISSFKFALKTLKDKKVLGIFPEGTRNKSENSDELLELKNGAIVFASKGDSFIVPMVLYKRSKIFRRNYLLIGEPLHLVAEDTKRLSHEEQENNTKRLADAINQLRLDMDRKLEDKKSKRKGGKHGGKEKWQRGN